MLSFVAWQVAADEMEPLRKRLAALQDIEVTFESTVTYTPDLRGRVPMAPDGKPARPYTGVRSSVERFRFLDGQAYYDSTLDEATLELVKKEHLTDPLRTIQSYAKDRSESYVLLPNLQYKVGGAENKLESFHIKWPNGSRVKDFRTGESYIITTGPRTLEDEELRLLGKGNGG